MVEVRTRNEALAAVDQALAEWTATTTGLLEQAQSAARAAMGEAESIRRRREAEVRALEAILSAADDQRRRALTAELVRATEALDRAARACARIRLVETETQRLARRHTTEASPRASEARSQLSAMSRALDGYRLTGPVTAGIGPVRRSTGTASTAHQLRGLGLEDVDVDAADLAENPIRDDSASGTFGKGGLSRADYRWAVQTWADVVAPGITKGKTREDFAARDARAGAPPLRRTADVYDLFVGSNRLKVDRRPDGSLNVINGRHRLTIARELGIKSLPAQVAP